MKYYKRYCSLLLVFVLSFGLFSIQANAETIDTSNYKVNVYAYGIGFFGLNNPLFGNLDLLVGEAYKEAGTVTVVPNSTTGVFRQQLTFVDTTGKALFNADNTYSFTTDNLLLGTYYYYNSSSGVIFNDGTYIDYYLYVYNDGTRSERFYNDGNISLIYNNNTETYSIKLKAKPTKDVYQLIVYVDNQVTIPSSYVGKSVTFGQTFGTPFQSLGLNFTVTLEKSSEEAGLLSGIIEWIKGIFNSIIELPAKLWSLISDGLKSLFVPDSEYMASYSDKWDTLLSSRFGAIYDVATIIHDFVGQIQVADKTNTIYMPSVNLNSAGIPFSFGGYNIQIVPTGFTILIEICKKIISIACTFLFVNSLRKRYDEVMGVEQ